MWLGIPHKLGIAAFTELSGRCFTSFNNKNLPCAAPSAPSNTFPFGVDLLAALYTRKNLVWGEDDDPGTQNPPKAQEKPNYFFQSRPEVSHELSEATSSAGGDQNSFTSLPLLFFILVWSVRTTSIPQPGCSSSSPQQTNIDNQLRAPEMFGRSFFVPLLSLSARITPRNGDARAALMR